MNTKNLILLRDYLIALPDDYAGFDMGTYNEDIEDIEDFDNSLCPTPIIGNYCGTSACVAGHMIYVKGLPPKGGDEGWWEYSCRVSGLDYWCNEFDFLFSVHWENLDNTVSGAVFRINYLMKNPNADYSTNREEFCIEHKLGDYA
jgi:hypothetical protein